NWVRPVTWPRASARWTLSPTTDSSAARSLAKKLVSIFSIAASSGRPGLRARGLDALGRVQHGVDDRLVAGAAADIARDGAHRVLTARFRIARQQAGGRHDHAGRAEAALRGEAFKESFLDGMQPLRRRHAFDRVHRGVLDRLDRDQA